MAKTTTKTFCRICVAFCGLEVVTENDKVVSVGPDKDNPYNWRDFCQKAGSSHKMRDHPRRLTTPMKRVGDKYEPVPYQQAIQEIAAELNRIRDQHGADAIGTYLGNPGMLNTTGAMFQGGFLAGLGTNNNYSAISVDTGNLHLVNREMYGCEMAMLIPDVDHAQCMLLLGTNPAVSTIGWVDCAPDGWNRMLAAQKKGADIIIVDPRETPSTRKANTHVRVKPGEDWALLLALIKIVFEKGWVHQQDCSAARAVDTIRSLAEKVSLDELSQRCQVSSNQIEDIAQRFASAETAFCIARTGIAQNRNGTVGEWLSHVLNLITGRIDRKGGRVYSPGIFENSMVNLNRRNQQPKPPSRIGGFKPIFGSYPLATLADEILTPGEGQIRGLIIDAGNPVITGPDGNKLDRALAELDLLIGIDFFQRESHRHAHWLIPASHFLEREDFTSMVGVILEKPFIQFGQAAITPLNGIKPEWEFYRDLTLEMGVAFMGNARLNRIIRASRWLARITGNARLAFNPRWLWSAAAKTSSLIKWSEVLKKPSGYFYAEKSYGHFRPALQTEDGLINAAPEEFVSALQQRLAEPVRQANPVYPLQLVNQRRASMMNSWLVETVKRKKVYGDFVEMSPADAEDRNIIDGQHVTVRSETAAIEAKARLTTELPPGVISMDHGWGSRIFDPTGRIAPTVQAVNRNLLIASDALDEQTGIPNLNGTYVEVSA